MLGVMGALLFRRPSALTGDCQGRRACAAIPPRPGGPSVRYCVMVIVRVADWLIAPEPLVDAETETMLVPRGVPGFPPLPPLHEIRPDATIRKTSKPKSRRPSSGFLRRAARLRTIHRTGNRAAKVGRSD